MPTPKPTNKEPENRVQTVRLTISLSLIAYDAIIELQRLYRKETGRALPLWKILDAAVISYAKRQGLKIRQ